jgi:hypothetical protein
MKIQLGHALELRVFGPGRVTVLPDEAVYLPGTVVHLTAVPEEGRRFTGWSGDVAGPEISRPITVDKSLGIVAHFECVPGDTKWEFWAGHGALNSSPAIGADGTLYVGSDDGNLYALDGTVGAPKWAFLTGDSVYSSPAIGADGTVYVGSLDGSLYALDGSTGLKRWEFATGDSVYCSPALGVDGSVYIGSRDKKIYALDGKTGAKRWDFTTEGEVFSSPAIGADGAVYFGSRDHKVYPRSTRCSPLPRSEPMERCMWAQQMALFTPWTEQPGLRNGPSQQKTS